MSAHVKHLLIAALIAAVVLGVTWKLIASSDQQAHDKKILAEEQLKKDLDTAKIQAQATATDKAALQAQLNALSASNAALQRDLATLRLQLANQRQVNDSLAPDALSTRWSMLIGVNPAEITPSANGIVASVPAAHATVNALEEVPVLKAEKAKLEENSGLKDTALAQAQKTLVSTSAELDTCKATFVDAQAVCKAQIAEVKSKARKRNIVLSVLAAIGGFLLRSKI